jgi:plasmid stabilization system protein ParE
MIVRFHLDAARDILEIFQYLQERNPSGAANVARAIHQSIASIARQPLASQQTEVADVRAKIVQRYPCKIFYNIAGNTIEIHHVRHTSRRPWTGG